MHHPNVVLYLSHFSDVDGDINILYELMDWNLANRLRGAGRDLSSFDRHSM